MGSYLEAYGSQEALRARRIRLIKIVSLCSVLALVLGLILYSSFRNYREESQVKAFLRLLRDQQFQDAYRMWGCTEETPCPNYPFPKFREDWGPGSQHPDAAQAKIGDAESCGSGVLVQVVYPHGDPVALWVERNTMVIGFSPFDTCPGRHLHIGAFFKSLFGK